MLSLIHSYLITRTTHSRRKYLKISAHTVSRVVRVCVCVRPSPVHWRVWTMPSCRPGSRCPCSAAPDLSVCSRSAGSGRLCRRPTPAARAGGGTRRWPSPLPGGRCTAARVAGWSCSTPAAGREKDRSFRASYIVHLSSIFKLIS